MVEGTYVGLDTGVISRPMGCELGLGISARMWRTVKKREIV